jgi:hypothetical protein
VAPRSRTLPRLHRDSFADSPEYSKVLVEHGFVAFSFDYRDFGGSTKWCLIPLEQIDDRRKCISFFEAQPRVDPNRIGLWGRSFAGANAPFMPPPRIHASRRWWVRVGFGSLGLRSPAAHACGPYYSRNV